jgi:hypothetical protein
LKITYIAIASQYQATLFAKLIDATCIMSKLGRIG